MAIRPKEKARELVDTFYKKQIENGKTPCWGLAKESANYHIEEVLDLFVNNEFDSRFEYYTEVKIQLFKI